MTMLLPTLTDAEFARCRPPAFDDDEPGFGGLSTPRGCLPLTDLDVGARIDGLLARTTVRQTFVNTLAEPVEATYIFPLPDRAAVTAFRMEVAGRVVEGELQERGAARAAYDAAIRTGHRAAISEEERPGVFTIRVGNLMPGDTAVVRLTLVGPLPVSDSEATFCFPLVVAPRYIPGVPLDGRPVGAGTAADTDAVPDASRISPPVLLPGFPNPVRLSIGVELNPAGLAVGDIRSSLHSVVETVTGRVRHIVVRPGERLDRDFVLRYRLAADAVDTALTLRPDVGSEEPVGTFAVTVVPPASEAKFLRPRDVILLLDRSGSMEGWKMVAARRALARMVDTLTDADTFNVYAFDDSVETPPAFGRNALVPATDRNRFRAVEWLSGINSRGGTELADPLNRAANVLIRGESARDRVLILVTDGQVGNEDQILRMLGDRARMLRVFTLGIDRAVNEAFLRRLAMLGGGACEVVESEDRLDEVMDKVHRRIAGPVLTGLRLEAGPGLEIAADSLVPARLPDLFAGTPVTLMGRYRGSPAASLKLLATDAAGRPWMAALTASVREDSAVPAVWAKRMIRELEDRFVIGGADRPALERRIVDTSLRFGVLCRFTAYVAVDRAAVVNEGGRVHQLVQAVEMPSGWAGAVPAAAAAMPASFASAMPVRRRATSAPGGAPDLAKKAAPPPAPMPAGQSAMSDSGLYDVAELESAASPPVPLAEPMSAPEAEDEAFAVMDDLDLERGPVPAKPAAPPSGMPRKRKEARAEKAEAAAPALDLSAYRRRAEDLREMLRQRAGGDAAGRLTALGMLSVKLAELLEDLRSVGAAVPAELEKLLADLRAAVAGSPTDGDAAALWTAAETALTAFATGSPPPDAPQRERFWA